MPTLRGSGGRWLIALAAFALAGCQASPATPPATPPTPVAATATPVAVRPAVATTTPTALPTAEPAPTSGVTITQVNGARGRDFAAVTAKAPANTPCTIAYFTPAGTRSTAQGLQPRSTDADGVVSWSWVIGSSTRPCTGKVTVACGGAEATTPIEIGR